MRSILFCTLLFLVVGCEETREFPQEIPIVITEEIVPGKGKETELTGTIKTLGSGHNIIAYGFLWEVREQDGSLVLPTLSSPQLTVSGEAKVGTFSHKLTTEFQKGIIYNVRSFLQTDKLTIYGNNVYFTVEDVPNMVVEDFNPKSGFDGTEVTITGSYLGTNTSKSSVEMGAAGGQIISVSDTVWKFKIPVPTGIGKYRIYVRYTNRTASTPVDFTLLGPKITSISPASGKTGDIITLEGEYFDTVTDLKVYWDVPSSSGGRIVTPTIVSPTKMTVPVSNQWSGSAKLGLVWRYANVQKVSPSEFMLQAN